MILMAATLAVSWVAHVKAGWTLPVPWPDESAFLWQSISFMEHGSLFTPVLNPNQHIMWMPPGYMVLTGLLFKLVPFSLANARWLSWLFSVTAYLGILTLFKETRRTIAPVITVIVSVFFLGSFFVVMGNVARMESLLLAMVVWSFVLLAREKVWYALSILLAAGLVHPNGAYFFVAGLAWCGWNYGRSWPAAGRLQFAACGAAVLLVFAYGAYVLTHWTAFSAQMAFQLERKRLLFHDTPRFLLNFKKLSFVAGYLVTMVVAVRVDRRVLLPLLLGCAAFAAFITTREMWYDVFFVLSIVLLAGNLVLLVDRLAYDHHKTLARITAGALAALFVAFGLSESFAESPLGYPARMRWHEMRIGDSDVQYIKHADVTGVVSVLDSLATDPQLKRVQFYPHADALLFRSQTGARWSFVQPVFTEPTTDVVVVHVSRYLPASWDEMTRRFNDLAGSGVWASERDVTESWRIGVIPKATQPEELPTSH